MAILSKCDFKRTLLDPLYIIKRDTARFIELAASNGFRANPVLLSRSDVIYITEVYKKCNATATDTRIVYQTWTNIMDEDLTLLHTLATEAFDDANISVMATGPFSSMVILWKP